MNRNYSTISYAESPFGTLSEFMSKSFGWMFAGLLVTFAVGIGAVMTGLIYPLINSGLFILTSIGVYAVCPGAEAAALDGHGNLLRLCGAERPEPERNFSGV